MKKMLNVAVFMGGPSAEHEVSLKSGAQILKALDRKKYRVTPVLITKNGLWNIAEKKSLRQGKGIELLRKKKIEVAIILALHGEFGEDGRMQALLETAGIPYTGSGVLASALGMDKARSAFVFRAHGLSVPEFLVIKKNEIKKAIPKIKKHIGFPCVIKPVHLGSSVGVSIVKEEHALPRALQNASARDNEVIVQAYVKGRELTCGVIEKENGKLIALPPTEIIAKTSSFFDYRAKYIPGASDEITPAHIPNALTKKIQHAALTAHEALGCRGISRTDFIIEHPKSDLPAKALAQAGIQHPIIWILEINTLPGMTATSLVPQAAKVAGISFEKLITMCIRSARFMKR